MKKKTEVKRQAIVEMAAEVFREKGFERASMSEIRQRVGGSNATLYNYFPSKEALFLEVMYQANESQFEELHAILDLEAGDIRGALQKFGEGLLGLLHSPEVAAVRRLITANFGNGELGRACFERGPKRMMEELEIFFVAAIKKKLLRPCDPLIAVYHLRALLEAELFDHFVFQIEETPNPERIKGVVERALSVFFAAYGPIS